MTCPSFVICPPSVHCPSSLTFHIFAFFFETSEWNSTKLYRKLDLNVLYQVYVFRADWKNKMAAVASVRWEIFDFSEIQGNLTWSKISTSSIKFVFFQVDWKNKMAAWPLTAWDIFDISSETAERDSTKLDKRQDLNVLIQFLFFGRIRKKDGWHGLWLAETFFTSPLKPINWIQRNLTGSKISTSFTKFVFFGLIGKTRWPALASDWLRHFGLLIWKLGTEFKESWQETRSQHPLPSLCFSNQLKKNKMAAWPLIGWDSFHFSETAEWNSMKLDRKQDLNIIYQVSVSPAEHSDT